MTPYSPLLHIVHIVHVYTLYLFTEGRGRGGELTREKVREEIVHKGAVENTNMTECVSSL
jgi:hypothetical protein